MIKTALKHWIYEICIEQVFDGVFKNFIKSKLPKLEINKVYSRIDYRFGKTCRYIRNARVLKIYKDGFGGPWIQLVNVQRRPYKLNLKESYSCDMHLNNIFKIEE